MVVYHASQEFLDDLVDLSESLLDFLNIRLLTPKAAKDGAVFALRAVPDQKRLGQRFRKEKSKVEAALASMSHERLEEFDKTGSMVVEGHVLTKEDVSLVRECRKSAVVTDTATWEAAEDAALGLLVVVNVAPSEALVLEGHSREVQNRVQRLRKKAGLLVTEQRPVTVYWRLDDNNDAAKAADAAPVRRAIVAHLETLAKKTNTCLVEGLVPNGAHPLATNDLEAPADGADEGATKERLRMLKKREVNGVPLLLALVLGE